MNKTDTALARRSLLERWQLLFKEAIAIQQREERRLDDLAPGEPMVPPSLIIPKPSSDMTKLLLSGIESALAGNEDPFMIREPWKAPIKSWQQRIEIVAELMVEINKRKTEGKRNYRQIAIDFVAGRQSISAHTLESYLKEKDICEFANLVQYQKKR